MTIAQITHMMKNITKSLFPVIFGVLLALPVQAQIPPGKPITLGTIQLLITQVVVFLIIVSGIIAVIFIIWSGIMYMMAGDDTTKATAAKGKLKSAIIGAAIILGVGVIMATVQAIVTCGSFLALSPC